MSRLINFLLRVEKQYCYEILSSTINATAILPVSSGMPKLDKGHTRPIVLVVL